MPQAARILTEDLRYPAGEVQVPAVLSRPRGAGPYPAVLIAPAVHGITPYIREVARELAAAGFLALAFDYYAREGGPGDLSTPQGIQAQVAALPDTRVVSDMSAGLAYLRGRSDVRGDAVASLGFCVGGLYAFLAACELDLAACVDFYGMIEYDGTTPNKPVSPLDRVPDLRAPLLAHFAEHDAWITAAQRERLVQALVAHGKVYEMYVYPGAPHAFHDHTRPGYRPVAAAEAWRRTLAFLRWYLDESRA